MEILNTTVVTETVSWYVPAIFICGILACICFMILSNTCNDVVGLVSFIVIFTFIGAMLYIGISEPQVETDRKRYEVILDESVSLIEIYDKYDVIEQRGKIWILEDKK